MPPKRKSGQEADDEVQPPPRRSTRQRTSTAQARQAVAATAPKSGAKKKTALSATAVKENPAATKAKRQKKEVEQGDGNGGETGPPRPVSSASPQGDAASGKANGVEAEGATEEGVTTPAAAAAAKTKSKPKPAEGVKEDSSPPGRQYWLMKAEPETRLENGVDVRFSIDDLAARKAPEPWDGIRNFVARNNLRAMKKGDLAFFYHSNCKEPGIVGTMEIVREHSPDLTAHDPKCPYYDPKSKPSDPRWSVVHVEFRDKFPVPIGLKELREMGGEGGPLRDMQVLRQSRLSVSRVSAEEWAHLVGVAGEKAAAQAGA